MKCADEKHLKFRFPGSCIGKMLVSLHYNIKIVMVKRGTVGSCSLLVITRQNRRTENPDWDWGSILFSSGGNGVGGVIFRTRWTLVYYPWCIILVSRDLVNSCCPSVHLACNIFMRICCLVGV